MDEEITGSTVILQVLNERLRTLDETLRRVEESARRDIEKVERITVKLTETVTLLEKEQWGKEIARLDTSIKGIEDRLRPLENWRNYVMGACAILYVIQAVIVAILLKKVL